jgi:hypothetical protein
MVDGEWWILDTGCWMVDFTVGGAWEKVINICLFGKALRGGFEKKI